MNRPAIPHEAIVLIKSFEGFRAKAYLDTLAKPPVWTIGYGTTAAAGVGIVPKSGMVITEPEAEWYLQKAVDQFAAKIWPGIQKPITPQQFGAFVSLAYNIGPGAFLKSSALRQFNAGDNRKAADAMLLWNKAGGKVLKGLVRRREAEKALFLSQAPTPTKTAKAPQTAQKPQAQGVSVVVGAGAVGAATVAVAFWEQIKALFAWLFGG